VLLETEPLGSWWSVGTSLTASAGSAVVDFFAGMRAQVVVEPSRSGRGVNRPPETGKYATRCQQKGRAAALTNRTYVGKSRIHGRGLFAAMIINAGETSTTSHLLITKAAVPREFARHVYNLEDGRTALPCGDGIFVNHADNPNSWAKLDLRSRTISVIALHDIRSDEEITIDYRG
jgi:hypothetical protein